MVVTFDLDGVIADGRYTELHTRDEYWDLPLHSPQVPEALLRIGMANDVYVITARHYPGATRHVKDWLRFNKVNVNYIDGIITGINWRMKPFVFQALKANWHIDDHPELAKLEHPEVLLMDNPHWPANQKCQPYNFRLYNWPTIEHFCDSELPHMEGNLL